MPCYTPQDVYDVRRAGMSGELLAIIAAAAWAADSILVRKGTPYSTPTTAALISFTVTAGCLLPYVLYTYPLQKIFHPANLFFVVSGLIQPALVRLLFYTGIVRLGVSRAGPIRGTSPLFSLIIAFLVLSERPGWLVYFGAVLTVAGVWFVSYRREGEAAWRTRDLIFPLSAAMIAAVSQNIRKSGLLIVGEPMIAATINTTTSLVVFIVSIVISGNAKAIQFNRQSFPYFGAAALVALCAQAMTFIALDRVPVSVASPLLNTSPLFIIAFSALFLRDVEKVTKLTVVGVVLLVGGMFFITGR